MMTLEELSEHTSLITPEAQGIDSGLLTKLLEHIQLEGINLHSLLIVRNGAVILESYWHPYNRLTLNDLRSAAKSVISILVGIAIGRGYLSGVQETALSFFPGHSVANLDARKQAINLEHLLTMTSGLDLTDGDTFQMMQSPDWLQFVLNAPMIAQPGSRFCYTTCNTYLLSAVLQAATGQPALDFARQHLFDPLGITSVRWMSDPQGRTAGTGLYMTALDMAKIGQLYLQNGVWNGQQLVTPEWVQASTTAHIDSYGYHWWVGPIPGTYRASGYGGQMVYVLPEQQMVVVMTAGLSDPEAQAHPLLTDFILPAVKSPSSLPANPENMSALRALARLIEHPLPAPSVTVPELAECINNKRYQLEHNSFGWKSFVLSLTAEKAHIRLVMRDDDLELPIGTDNRMQLKTVQRFGMLAENEPIALKGAWQDTNTFVLHLAIVGSPEHWQITLTFVEATVLVRVLDSLSGQSEAFSGHVE